MAMGAEQSATGTNTSIFMLRFTSQIGYFILLLLYDVMHTNH